jgi:16S rRNA (cytosine967-C5)-methyltransferase
LRRNPDAKWVLSKKDLQYYNMRQIRFLEQLAALVRPGGKMVYAVCSNEPEETEAVVETFLRRHPEFQCQPPDLTGIPEAQRLVSAEGYFQTYPHRHAMDGFFGACLTRR